MAVLGWKMAQLMSGSGSAEIQSTRNLEEMAEYLRDMLLERHASADAALLAEALQSIERQLIRPSLTSSEKRPAA
jgi:hypothetical protein